tara:strand:- start:1260 stop:1526 length:267 start_codon:yes stop_codon:yes gene_type:complete
MEKRGGAREGAGRKPKAEEQKLIEKLSPLEPKAYQALENAIEDNQHWAVKIFFEYMYGRPKQQIDQNNTHEFSEGFDLKKLYGKDSEA